LCKREEREEDKWLLKEMLPNNKNRKKNCSLVYLDLRGFCFLGFLGVGSRVCEGGGSWVRKKGGDLAHTQDKVSHKSWSDCLCALLYVEF